MKQWKAPISVCGVQRMGQWATFCWTFDWGHPTQMASYALGLFSKDLAFPIYFKGYSSPLTIYWLCHLKIMTLKRAILWTVTQVCAKTGRVLQDREEMDIASLQCNFNLNKSVPFECLYVNGFLIFFLVPFFSLEEEGGGRYAKFVQIYSLCHMLQWSQLYTRWLRASLVV